MNIEPIYWALAVSNQIRENQVKLREDYCRVSFMAHFFLEHVAVSIKGMMSGNRDFPKINLDVQKCYVYVARLVVTMTTIQIKSN